MPAVALVVAAGRGERLGSDGPKALVPLAGRPMLEWSIAALVRRRRRSGGSSSRCRPAARRPRAASPSPAGAERSHSVRNALAEAGADADVVLVHDAARPLLTPELVASCLAALDEDGEGWDAAIAAAPVTDTVKRAPDGVRVVETLDRSELWAVQTPQVFRRAALRAGAGAQRR